MMKAFDQCSITRSGISSSMEMLIRLNEHCFLFQVIEESG